MRTRTTQFVGALTQVFLKLRLDEDPATHRGILAVLAFLRS